MVAGREASPNDVESTARLFEYWERGPGAAKIRWGEPHDWYRCVAHISKYVGTDVAKRMCTNMHEHVLGVAPGKEKV